MIGRAPLLDAYGEVLYRAWRTAVGGPAAELERTVLGGLASAALGASTPALATSLRRVLAALTDAKGAPGVDALLVRLLRPILFRALAAPNPAVRRNAGALLFASFPLQDPAAPAAEGDELMARQAQAMADLLADDAPLVRAAAVAGLAQVLDVFWELLPPATSAAYVTRLVDGLAHDAAAPAVRAAVATALARLVANPAAQPLLRPLLPRAAHLLRDSSAAVRSAFAELLVAARGVRSIKFYDIVAIEELHAALASEEPRVARVLTRLLLPTYFPGGLPLADAAKRVVALAGVAPATAAAFARHAAAAGAPRPALKALARVLAVLLAAPPGGAAAAPAPAKKAGKRRGRDASPPPAPAAALSPDLWLALADALAELCTGLQRRGEEKADAKAAAAEAGVDQDDAPPATDAGADDADEQDEDDEAMAKGLDAKGVMAALRAAPSAAGRAAVARAGAALPAADAVPLAAHCRAALAAGCDDDGEAAALMAGLCAWCVLTKAVFVRCSRFLTACFTFAYPGAARMMWWRCWRRRWAARLRPPAAAPRLRRCRPSRRMQRCATLSFSWPTPPAAMPRCAAPPRPRSSPRCRRPRPLRWLPAQTRLPPTPSELQARLRCTAGWRAAAMRLLPPMPWRSCWLPR